MSQDSPNLSPIGHLYAQAEKKVSDRCDACGHLLEVGYSTKHQAWLCREHFNHSMVEQMIFSQKVAGPYVAIQTDHKCHFDVMEFSHEFYDGSTVKYDTRFGIYLCAKCMKSSDDVIANGLDRMKNRQASIVGGPAVSPFDNTWSEQVVKTAYHDNDAIDTNEQGGKQSHLEYRFDLIEPEFMLRMAHVLHTGALKYGDRNWQSIPMDHNIGRAIYHLEMALQGLDHSEDHFANAACRVMFAMLTAHGVRYPSGKI